MSTTPGRDTWADAGLVPPDDAEEQQGPADDEALPRELPPDAPEADALEQHLAALGLPPEPPHLRDDAAEHDLIEQAQDVPVDDEEYPTS